MRKLYIWILWIGIISLWRVALLLLPHLRRGNYAADNRGKIASPCCWMIHNQISLATLFCEKQYSSTWRVGSVPCKINQSYQIMIMDSVTNTIYLAKSIIHVHQPKNCLPSKMLLDCRLSSKQNFQDYINLASKNNVTTSQDVQTKLDHYEDGLARFRPQIWFSN